MSALSPWHLIIVLVVALLVIGPGKLAETGGALGRTIREFRQSVSGDFDSATPSRPAATAAPTETVAPATTKRDNA